MHSTVARALGAFVVCFGSFATALSPALAEVWPERGVKIITSFPAGTGGDLSARLYAERLALRWGKPVIVENKPGADGILAVTAVIGARDNHTLLYTNGGPVTTNGFNHDKLPYDPVRDLIPISSGADVSIAVSIPASLKIDSLRTSSPSRGRNPVSSTGALLPVPSTMSCRVFSSAWVLI